MTDDSTSRNSATLLVPPQTSKPVPGSVDQSSQLSQLSPVLSQDHLQGWETIGEQQDFYNEQDCLRPHHNLASEKLKTRKEDDVVIFDYSLDPGYGRCVDGNPLVEAGGPSSRHSGTDDSRFFRVSKKEFIGSSQFDQTINPTKESWPILSRGPRLAIMDFPQCYDTYDDSLLNSMAEKLGLQQEGETAFMEAYSQRVRALPGHRRFRTGVSLRAPFKKPSELPKLGSSEDRFILFVSFPYFGRSSEEVTLDQERESLKLLDFRLLGVDASDRRVKVSEEERADIGEILVHQARYMIFDNYTMATFRSKEDSSRDQVPLHRFQERVGAFRAVIQMIANRTGLELWTLRKLQASLHKLEEDIDEMILDSKTYEDNQGMAGIPDDAPAQLRPWLEMVHSKEELLKWDRVYERVRQNTVRKRKQGRIRDLHIFLNRLSATFLATISVAEQQVAVLQDLHGLFSTSYRTKTKDGEKEYPLWQNPLLKNIFPIPIISQNPEQEWQNTLDIIGQVVRERKSFIKKIKVLVQSMEVRREILSGFLKSDAAKAAPSEKTAQEAADAMTRAEGAMRETQEILQQQAQQTNTLSIFTVVTTAFLPLSFLTSYFGMNNIKNSPPIPYPDWNFGRSQGQYVPG
ncbi:hypothetical protein B9Z19DRAFT_1073806 [Tuber borchii]|uniref:Uncharacterized protein n=1 Tax=Tuber borchii TaxID=42251 RepID=A0A2T7A5C5_TUBBO|nr:hypothetical protein B9Z19DRAFT_1073806 [Tuber borchii]